jgi:ABC-type polysaccharide/polyol phosphate export permease
MVSQVLPDISATLRRHDLWRTLGSADIKFRYRRTVLGPFWLTLSTGVMIFAIGLTYSVILHQDLSSYFPKLAIGIILWNFISSTVSEGCSLFTLTAAFIKSYAIPLPIYIFRSLWRNVLIFSHNILIVPVIWLVVPWKLSPIVLLSLVGYVVMLLFVLGLALFFSVICTRFRDIPQIVSSVLQLTFFITPIMWSPDALGSHRWLAELNPFFSIIELVREPLLNQIPDFHQWLIAICSALISLACGAAVYDRYAPRIAYWL